MKYCVEFGNRGGAHVDNLVVPTCKAAVALASRLVLVFTNDPHNVAASEMAWPAYKAPRITWQSQTHFVAVSRLDGKDRGPAAADLWPKSDAPVMWRLPVERG